MAGDTSSLPMRGDRRRTAEYFTRLASTYGDGRYYRLRRRAVVDAITAEIRDARAVLDLGCGNGNYLSEFAKLRGAYRLVGVDLTCDMLLEARDRAPAVNAFARADVTALPIDDEAFDIVFCSHVLPFIPELETAVGEISRCLSANGLLIATLPGDSIVRAEIERLLGAERYEQFARLVFRRARRSVETHSENERYRATFERIGLRFEQRDAPFTITWQDVDEWIRIRWFPVMEPSDHRIAEQLLAEVAASAGNRTLALVEPLVIGRKSLGSTS